MLNYKNISYFSISFFYTQKKRIIQIIQKNSTHSGFGDLSLKKCLWHIGTWSFK